LIHCISEYTHNSYLSPSLVNADQQKQIRACI
jgi:hypothetical protein